MRLTRRFRANDDPLMSSLRSRGALMNGARNRRSLRHGKVFVLVCSCLL
jgi:hypothetical protein